MRGTTHLVQTLCICLISVNYIKRLGGPDDELKSIQDNLRQLQHKESLYAVVENLKVSISTNEVLRNMVHTQENEKVLSWLSLNESQNNHNNARKKHEPTTGDWFLQSEMFTQWLNSTNSSLWLYGKAGSGKTILCSTIIQHIIDSTPAVNCAYFYFDFQVKWKADDMLRSVIVQLCKFKNEIPLELHQLYRQCLNGERRPQKSSLVRILSLLLTSRTFLLLDALDECTGGADRNDLLDTIEEIIKTSQNLNLLATSRKEVDIEKRLKPLFDNRMALEENVVDADIYLYVRRTLTNDDELREWDSKTKEEIQDALVKGANGMYDQNITANSVQVQMG